MSQDNATPQTPQPPTNPEKIIAVVVTYNSDENFATRLASYQNQVAHTIIVDNSPDPQAAARIKTCATASLNTCADNSINTCADDSINTCADACLQTVTLLANGENIGLAAAQNRGITRALDMGATWVLLMDDDSIVPSGMIAAMMAAKDLDKNPATIGLLAPRIYDRNSGHEGKMIVQEGFLGLRRRAFDPDKERMCDTVLTVIASGSLLNVRAIEKIGLMKESYFVDGIDIEYALRLRKNGFRLCVARDALLSHSLGKKTLHRLCGLTFVTTNHPAWRRRTMTRNRMDVWKTYAQVFPIYVLYDVLVSLFEMLKIALFENQKKEKLAACLAGFREGFQNAIKSRQV